MNVQVFGPTPMTRNMPYASASMPSQSQPRNMTGIYLGLEGNQRPPRPKTGVPPLARSRGSSRMRTPTEEQRYKKVELLRIKEEKRGFIGSSVKRHLQRPTTSLITSLTAPSKPASAFLPPSYTPGTYSPDPAMSEPSNSRKWGPGRRINYSNIDDLLKTNPRKFTANINSGVTRSEKLTGRQKVFRKPSGKDPEMFRQVAYSQGSEDVDLAGLEECFRKVCRGNVDVLYSLLPGKRPQTRKGENTGFSVRSYRNPTQAEIMADFPDPRASRPMTVPIRSPLVPQPYFFRHYTSHPGAATIAEQQQLKYQTPGSMLGTLDEAENYFSNASRIQAAPGAGNISRSLQQRTQSPSTLTGDPSSRPRTEPQSVSTGESRHTTSPTPVLTLPGVHIEGKGFQSGETTSKTAAASEESGPSTSRQGQGQSTSSEHNTNTNTSTAASTPRFPPDEGDDNASVASSNPAPASSPTMEGEGRVNVPVTEVKEPVDEPCSTTEDSRPRPKLTASNSGADIMLGLETDEGQSAEVEIDTADQDELMPEAEAPKGRVRKASITEKVIKSKASEALAAMIKEEAETRQKEFEKLLDEHAELVQEISRTPSSENLIQGERDH